MTPETKLEFDHLPAVAPSYFRAATTLSDGLRKGGTIPSISATIRGLTINQGNLAQYRKVCGFGQGKSVPITYPHVLAFPIHMSVMTHRQFPLKLLGLIHVKNEISQYRAIASDEPLDLTVSVGGHREVSKGIEFDLVTKAQDASGATIWSETGVMLSRRKSGGESGAPKARTHEEETFKPEHESRWQVSADIGRRYASAAGDYNPIHLSPWSAKLFGFPRAIATGMWLKARAAADIEPQLNQSAHTLSVAFKKPVFLPSTAILGYSTGNEGLDFALTNSRGDVVHLRGEVRYL